MKTTSFREVVRHPVTLAAGAFSAGTALTQWKVLSVVGVYLLNHVGELFTIASLAGFTVAPNLPFIPETPLVVLAVVTGVAFLAKKLYEMYGEIDAKLKE